MSLTEMVSSLIWRSRRMTSRCRKNISPSRLYHLSKYCWQIFFRSSMEAESRSALVPHLSAITLSLLCLPLLLLLQLLRSFLPEQGPQLLLPLGGHESLLLGHGDGFLLPVLDGDESLAQFPRHSLCPSRRSPLGKTPM